MRAVAAAPWFQITSVREAIASATALPGPLPYGPNSRSAPPASWDARRALNAGSLRSSSIRSLAPDPAAQARSPAAD